ncbi:BTB domain-containing protein [Caenorhabditis elegans]|uniref:BTB domain-containing protein n=1 Tax=Caenorhabditis elegans TaxID=6239 RepID=Q7JP41_CAEEL|nr:BTB domain-containing protein [Caenorhabditis elegans]CCD69271.2 BTB domain-containing protein [Caenorhabditis elegans]
MSQSEEQNKDIPSSSNFGNPANNGVNVPDAPARRLFDNTSDESDVSLDNDDKTGAETDGSSSSRGCLKSERSRKDHASTSSTRTVRAPQQVSWSFGAKPATPHSQPPAGLKKENNQKSNSAPAQGYNSFLNLDICANY